MKLEVGPGYSRRGVSYRFNPSYCPGHDVVYLDLNSPDFKLHEGSWIVADAHRLPLRNDAVDEIFAGHVIEHLENPLQFLRECRRVLKRGGTVTLVTPNFLSANAYPDPGHRHVFNFIKLSRLVRMSGLTPHFPSPNIGSLLHRKLRLLIKVILLFLSDNLTVVGEKL